MGAEQTLKSALEQMDNGAVTTATVDQRVGGQQLTAHWKVSSTATTGTSFEFQTAGNAAVNVQGLCVGDIIATNNYNDAPPSSNVNGAQQHMYQIEKLRSLAEQGTTTPSYSNDIGNAGGDMSRVPFRMSGGVY